MTVPRAVSLSSALNMCKIQIVGQSHSVRKRGQLVNELHHFAKLLDMLQNSYPAVVSAAAQMILAVMDSNLKRLKHGNCD